MATLFSLLIAPSSRISLPPTLANLCMLHGPTPLPRSGDGTPAGPCHNRGWVSRSPSLESLCKNSSVGCLHCVAGIRLGADTVFLEYKKQSKILMVKVREVQPAHTRHIKQMKQGCSKTVEKNSSWIFYLPALPFLFSFMKTDESCLLITLSPSNTSHVFFLSHFEWVPILCNQMISA